MRRLQYNLRIITIPKRWTSSTQCAGRRRAGGKRSPAASQGGRRRTAVSPTRCTGCLLRLTTTSRSSLFLAVPECSHSIGTVGVQTKAFKLPASSSVTVDAHEEKPALHLRVGGPRACRNPNIRITKPIQSPCNDYRAHGMCAAARCYTSGRCMAYIPQRRLRTPCVPNICFYHACG